ncbi:hypothetical protein [Iningainema tapete]|uniref:Uncharacterized protein n=1 Tax=Iningainema tapete BLCC-T55 TaxID=2748662 RepID=A0A8J6XJ20_9CYAN|nr:hypothetical protein [Iningainema tapete]MBD2773727.1 hypothetical protein [Iningainema tapete BLCC-T55]
MLTSPTLFSLLRSGCDQQQKKERSDIFLIILKAMHIEESATCKSTDAYQGQGSLERLSPLKVTKSVYARLIKTTVDLRVSVRRF